MADTDTTAPETVAPVADETTADEVREAPLFPVSASPDALIGENTPVRDVTADVEDEPVEAQKMGEPAPRVTEVPVYEVVVQTDERVDYVIVPPEGRGSALLPIHAFIDAKTPDQVFAEAAEAAEAAASDADES